jgi:hypothetical protein
MANTEFPALVLEQTHPKEFQRFIQLGTLADPPPGEVLIRVDSSSPTIIYRRRLSSIHSRTQ